MIIIYDDGASKQDNTKKEHDKKDHQSWVVRLLEGGAYSREQIPIFSREALIIRYTSQAE